MRNTGLYGTGAANDLIPLTFVIVPKGFPTVVALETVVLAGVVGQLE